MATSDHGVLLQTSCYFTTIGIILGLTHSNRFRSAVALVKFLRYKSLKTVAVPIGSSVRSASMLMGNPLREPEVLS